MTACAALGDWTSKALRSIKVRSGNRIDAIQMYYVDEKGAVSSPGKHGGNGGNEDTFTLADDEEVVAVTVRASGSRVGGLCFVTNKSTTLPAVLSSIAFSNTQTSLLRFSVCRPFLAVLGPHCRKPLSGQRTHASFQSTTVC